MLKLKGQTMPYSFWEARKHAYGQENLYQQGIIRDINEHETSDCKYKHMMKNGAKPDNLEFPYHLLPIKFKGFNRRTDF